MPTRVVVDDIYTHFLILLSRRRKKENMPKDKEEFLFIFEAGNISLDCDTTLCTLLFLPSLAS